jgi:hypothetical protein
LADPKMNSSVAHPKVFFIYSYPREILVDTFITQRVKCLFGTDTVGIRFTL